MKRHIPATMATQHPDNASRPFWHHRPFVSSEAEIKEAYICFRDLGIDEYNWDWEGKFVDEAVVDRLLHRHFNYFRKNPLGKSKFLTFRFPNPRVEKQFRLARALMVAVTASQLASSLGINTDPVFEAILPLTETAREILDIQEAFRELIGIEHKLLKLNEYIKHIEIIPLFESVETIISSDRIIREYSREHQKLFGFKPAYLRPYIARSDPALNSGIIPTILALKIALSNYKKLESELGFPLYPMLGTGSLPFRGGLNPESVSKCLDEYRGIRTFTIQSAFRYDYPKKDVLGAVSLLKEKISRYTARSLSPGDKGRLKAAILPFSVSYRQTVEGIAEAVNGISLNVAKRRERVQHIGLFGYSRGVGSVHLPRAITFTAALYSIGVPPELIGSGRGLKKACESGTLGLVLENYSYLKDDLVAAGNFLNKNNLHKLASKNASWEGIAEDVRGIEEILKVDLGPENDSHFEHERLTERILLRFTENKDFTSLITLTGRLRRSLG